MAQNIQLNGIQEISTKLMSLSDPVTNKKIVRSALRKAAKPLIQSARSKVMSYSKTIGRSITVNYTSRDGNTIGVGPKRTRSKVLFILGDSAFIGKNTRDPWFAHFVEFGTSGIGRFKKAGKKRYRADQPARPFMRPAFEETKEEIMKNFSEDVWESILKQVEKGNVARSTIR